jgi:protocatechuate 3,4-dioxygenase beta subunit
MSRRRIGWGLAIVLSVVVLGWAFRPVRTPGTDGSAAASAPPLPPARATLELTVLGAGKPVADAKVVLAADDAVLASGTTDAQGLLRFADVPRGLARLVVAHPRFQRQIRDLDLAGAMRVKVTLEGAVVLQVTVLDDRGQRVPSASIRVVTGDAHDVGQCETGPDGRCEVFELAPGRYTLRAHSGRHRPAVDSVRLVPGDTTTPHTIILAEGRVLSGRVVDPEGAAVPDARVGSSDPGGGFASTDADGRFELRGLGEAPINVFATAPGFAPRHVRALRTGTANVELRLERPASVEARVLLAGESRSLMVSVCELDSHFGKEVCVARRLFEPPTVDVRLEDLPSGTFDLLLEAEGHHPERLRVRLRSAELARAGDVRLRAAP